MKLKKSYLTLALIALAFLTSCGGGSGGSSGPDGSNPDENPVLGCGNGQLEAGEVCDDGNSIDNDHCDSDCIPSKIVQLDVGRNHACVLTRVGSVRCWGSNVYGELGYGNNEDVGDDESPNQAGDVDLGGKAVQISLGANHTCALLNTGEVLCWGHGEAGRLGYGNTNDIEVSPALIGPVPLGAKAIKIATGEFHTCALMEDQSVMCWSSGTSGKLGYGNTDNIGDDEFPSSIGSISIGGAVEDISIGGYSCAQFGEKEIQCWGSSTHGELGYGSYKNIGDDELLSDVPSLNIGDKVDQFSVGEEHICLLLSGKVVCWGGGVFGQLGYGNKEDIGDDELPTLTPVSLGFEAVQLDVGQFHNCAVSATGEVKCWGCSWDGRLGYGNSEYIGDDELPSSVGFVQIGGPAEQVKAGYLYSCALMKSGSVRCWGNGDWGALGYGNTDDIGDDQTPEEYYQNVLHSNGDVQIF